MGQAALQYARRGWPVFPCRECDGRPYLRPNPKGGDPETVTPRAKAPYVPTGLKVATTDEEQVRKWWKQWPNAMIGLPLGAVTRQGDGFFALDFDPRHDAETGEDFTLERLKGDLERMMGCPLPESLAVRTPSGGVHLYLVQPQGEAVRNRGNLPEHVDVRGQGGYVIAPPSRIVEPCENATAGVYRWLRGKVDAPVAQAPGVLVDILRDRRSRKDQEGARDAEGRWTAPPPEGAKRAPRSMPARPPAEGDDAVRDAVRRYGWAALEAELKAIRDAPSGRRNAQLNESALKIAALTCSTPIAALDAGMAKAAIEGAAAENPGRDDTGQLSATIDSGWSAGLANPRDLEEIASTIRERSSRRRRHPSGTPPARPPAPAAPPQADTQPFRNGRLEGEPTLSEGDGERLRRIAERWLDRKLETVPKEAKALTALAWGIGRRVAAGLLEEGPAKERLWPKCEDVADVSHADIDRALGDGFNRGWDTGPELLDLKCAGYPMTDFGIGERFRDRFGDDYRFTTGKGWFGWDGRRWKLLDQDEKTPPAEVVAAVFETVRLIQREARRMAETGLKHDENPHGLDRAIPKGKNLVLLSELMRIWGRQSETAGKPASIAMLARRWLTVSVEDFDAEKLAVNVLNGTLRFARQQRPDGSYAASVRLDPHRREDLSTKLAPVEYDPDASCPLYDGMINWAQPEPGMVRYLHQVGGYSLTGDTGEHKLWFWYGRGRNGKSTTIDSWCYFAGDYAGTTLVETFLDQGVKKRGDAATPDLARLGGVRMLRASEPEKNAKLNSALVKFVTGGEPVPVRALHRGFFDLLPRFKLIISGNAKPDIPDTDDGIWGRMKLINWPRHIDQPPPDAVNWPKKDPHLVDKIKAKEGSGVLNRLVEGLLDWLTDGLVEPKAVTEATQAYRDDSDPLARFLRFCTEPDPSGRVQSSVLHEVFCAWAKAASEREWTQKGFSKAMVEKGFSKKASDGMQWLGLRLIKEVHDFIDANGRVIQQGVTGPAPPPPDDPAWDMPP
jgi:putative DNA primase/helicase